MILIIITIVVMFLVLIFWSFTNLGKINIGKKILWMILLFGIVFLTTYVTFLISKSNIIYPSQEIMHSVQEVLVLLFSGVNGCFFILILLAFECGYMRTTQNGILQIMYNNQ